jgi:hypothetical protein
MGSIPKWLVNAANEKQPLCIAALRDYIKKNPQLQQEVQQKATRAAATAAAAASGSVTAASLLLPATGPEQRCGHLLGLQVASVWDPVVFASKFPRAAAFASSWSVGRTLTAALYACRRLWSMHMQTAAVAGRAGANNGGPVVGFVAVQVLETMREMPASTSASPWWSTPAHMFVRVTLDEDAMQTPLMPIEVDAPRRWRSASFALDNASFTLRVFNPLSRVRISVFSSLAGGPRGPMDRLIGEAFLPVADLSDQRARDGWLPLLVSSDSAGDDEVDPSHLRPMVKIGVRMVMAEAVDWLVTVATPPEGDEDSTPMGSEDVKGEIPEYVPEKLVANCFQLADVSRPVIAAVGQGFSLLNWEKPCWSAGTLAVLLLCCWWPGAIPMVLGLCVIVFIMLQYHRPQVSQKGTHRWSRLEAQHSTRLGAVVDLLRVQQPLRSPETNRLLRYVQYQAGTCASAIEDVLRYVAHSVCVCLCVCVCA